MRRELRVAELLVYNWTTRLDEGEEFKFDFGPRYVPSLVVWPGILPEQSWY